LPSYSLIIGSWGLTSIALPCCVIKNETVRKSGLNQQAVSDHKQLQIHVAYLRDLAQRLGGTDGEAVDAAAALLEALGDYLRNTGALK